MFPQWEFIDQEMIEPLDASSIRALYFNSKYNPDFLRSVVPFSTLNFLYEFHNTEDYKQILNERLFVEAYREKFKALPYEPTFVTADTIVVQSGHVLLIKRRAAPGKGLWALPGGYLNAKTDKSMLDCAMRELNEETKIKLPEKILRGNIKKSKVFDAIDRDPRGRIITHAFFIQLLEGEWNLPKIKGSDDAEKAVWMPISEVRRNEMYADHYDILLHFLGR
jgi:bifunctional NMN adenylyltransferase/nudix hydrolase